MEKKTTQIKSGGIAACGNSNTHSERGHAGCSPKNQDKPQSVWVDLGKFEVQGGVLLFDIDQIPESVQSIVWLSKSKCREFQRRKLAKDVVPQSVYDEHGV